MLTLKAEERDMSVKAKKLRRDGYIPCNLIGKEVKTPRNLKLNRLEAEMLLKKHKKGAQLVLQVGEEKIPVILKNTEFNPLKKEVDMVEFQMLVAGEKITATAPVVLLHEENIKEDYSLETEEVTYKACPEDLIEQIVIDFEKVDTKRSVKLKDLEVSKNEKLTFVTPLDHTLVSITEHKVKEEDEEAEEEAAAPVA